jgi:energy-coupling factor transporter transmembrane protein EcfT
LPTSDLRWLGRSLELLALATFVVLFFIVPDGAASWVLAINLVTFYLLFLRAIAVPDRILPSLPSYLSIEVLFLAFSYLIFYYQYQLFMLGRTNLSESVYVSNSFPDGSNKAITLATVGPGHS